MFSASDKLSGIKLIYKYVSEAVVFSSLTGKRQPLIHCNVSLSYIATSASRTLQRQLPIHCNVSLPYIATSASHTLQCMPP